MERTRKRSVVPGLKLKNATVLEVLQPNTNKWRAVLMCCCGEAFQRSVSRISVNPRVHCGCLAVPKVSPGDRFGSFVVVRPDTSRHRRGNTYWVCRCDCGEEKVIRAGYLITRVKCKNSFHYKWRPTGTLPGWVMREVIQHRSSMGRGGTPKEVVEIDGAYLEEVFKRQNGRCALSGLPIHFEETSARKSKGNASVDRVDSSLGYIPGNVQIVHKDINTMKSDLPQEDFLRICKQVAEAHGWVDPNSQDGSE